MHLRTFGMANSTTLNFMFVIILLHTVHAVELKPWVTFLDNRLPYSRLKYNITNEEHCRLKEGVLILATRNSTIAYKGVQMLSIQTTALKSPPEWILLDLANKNGVTTLALRNDNLYLAGFTNSDGQWFEFDNGKQLIPGSVIIEGNNAAYDKLGGRANMINVPLSKDNLLHAVQILLDYRYPYAEADPSAFELALAKIVLIVCEASRFRSISDSVENGWNTEGVFIEKPDRLICWGRISKLLLQGWPWPNSPAKKVVTGKDKYDTFSSESEFLAELNVLIRPMDYTPPS